MSHVNRREMLGGTAAMLAGGTLLGAEAPAFKVAKFSAEVTCPLGHACMGGGITPAKEIVDPLDVHGFALLGPDKPIVVACIDWCEIRNDAYDRWRQVLAEAAGTTPERVIFSSIHQHDTPIADLEAERLLKEAKAKGSVCMPEFHEQAVQRGGRALREAMKHATSVTHLGMGQGKVEKVASNRRYVDDDGKVRFGRTSATRDAKAREKPEGTIDPFVKTLSLWNGDQAIVALSVYSVHPMSYYGGGGVSADFPGMARRRRQMDDPKCLQIYGSGCSGNTIAGKYNDGNPANRPILADRLVQGMLAAWKATKKVPLTQAAFRNVKMRLEPRDGKGFTLGELQDRLKNDARPFGQCLAALGLSWRKRADAGFKIDVPSVDFGPAQLVLMPGESYVEYQLLAQKIRPDSFVVTLGYGECAPGYIPTEKHVAEGDGNLGDWCWVTPGSEKPMTAALEAALKAS